MRWRSAHRRRSLPPRRVASLLRHGGDTPGSSGRRSARRRGAQRYLRRDATWYSEPRPYFAHTALWARWLMQACPSAVLSSSWNRIHFGRNREGSDVLQPVRLQRLDTEVEHLVRGSQTASGGGIDVPT